MEKEIILGIGVDLMEDNKIKNNTKRLIDLVKSRKTPIVVYEHGSLKYSSRKSSSSGFPSESYSENDYE